MFKKIFNVLKKVRNSVKFIRWVAGLFEYAVDSYKEEFGIEEDEEEETTKTTEE